MLFLCNFIIVNVLFLNNYIFCIPCNMEVKFFDAVYFSFVPENYLSAKNNFLRQLEKWL